MKKYYQKNQKVTNSAIAENVTFENKKKIRAKKSLGLKPKFRFARAQKALGQNFLKSEIALRKMVEAGEIKKGDVILEIGPGKGALTEKLLEKIHPSPPLPKGEGEKKFTKQGLVIAVEKDRALFEFLKIKFEKEILEKKLFLINEDILKYEITKPHRQDLWGYKIIANIPYNITGAILKKFLTAKHQPTLMALMVQNEVAKRIMGANSASPRLRRAKESLLSISVKAYGEPKIIMKVDKRYFSPAPKVDSAIIVIKNISRKNFPPLLAEEGAVGGDSSDPLSSLPLDRGRDSKLPPRSDDHRSTPPLKGGEAFEQKFWKIVRAGFAHKRKKLSSNLKTLPKDGSLASVFGESLGNKRAEDLTLSEWLTLVNLAG